nr:10477_t:CDS:2 [Entrophospora candida]
MSPAKDGNYFVRVATRKGLDELQKSNNGILFNEDFNSWSYIRKVLIRATVSPSALRFAVTTLSNVFHDLEKLWDSLIEEQGQFLHDEQEKSVEIDFATWAKRIFAETTMLLIVGRQPNLLSTYYNRITNKNNIQKNSNEEFLDRLAIASDCVQYYVSVPSFILKERRKEIEGIDDKRKLKPDMLSMLLIANTPKDITQGISNNSDKNSMTDKEVGDNIVEVINEGIDSPTNALSFILHCVGNNPDVEQRIVDEIEKVFDHGVDFNNINEDLNKLEYIEAVIKEVLRIRPVTATISRFSTHSDQIDEYKIPLSTQLAINMMGLHKNPNYWKEPMEFNPSRFLANSSNSNEEIYNKNAFMYFGGGLRMCPGRQLAITQLKMMIVLLYNKYKFEVITKEPSMQHNVNIQCKELKIRIKCRKIKVY